MDAELETTGDELLPGAKLSNGSYTIKRHLKSGGFGITYIGLDTLGRQVVIKECFPSGMCARPSLGVQARSRSYRSSVSSLIEKFVMEAHTLARIDHPNIVKVHQVFRENDTAYMALDYVDGQDLFEIMQNPATALSPSEIRNALLKLLDAIELVHETGLLHRDISPDNILIDAKRNPVLIDFGAAREHGTGTERAASTLHVVKDGYSPHEFYLSAGNLGPWSDVYSLAATFYHVISGKAPPNSQQRLAAMVDKSQDPVVPLSGKWADYDAAFLQAIDKAMSVLPRDRIQTARQWIEAITDVEGATILHLPLADAVRQDTPEPPVTKLEPSDARKPVSPLMMVSAVAAIALVSMSVYLAMPSTEIVADAPAPTQSAAEQSAATPATAEMPPETAPSAMAGTSVEVAPLVTAWNVQLPFTATEGEPTAIAQTLGEVPEWMVPGVTILSVNGTPIERINDVPAILQASIDPGEADSISVTLVATAADGSPVEQSLDLEIEHSVILDTGATFSARNVNGAWETEVQSLPLGYGGEMKVGDVVVGHVDTNAMIQGPTDLGAILANAIAAGSEMTTLAVQRGGDMWVVALPLPK
jgi:serine/threonine protein kinase